MAASLNPQALPFAPSVNPTFVSMPSTHCSYSSLSLLVPTEQPSPLAYPVPHQYPCAVHLPLEFYSYYNAAGRDYLYLGEHGSITPSAWFPLTSGPTAATTALPTSEWVVSVPAPATYLAHPQQEYYNAAGSAQGSKLASPCDEGAVEDAPPEAAPAPGGWKGRGRVPIYLRKGFRNAYRWVTDGFCRCNRGKFSGPRLRSIRKRVLAIDNKGSSEDFEFKEEELARGNFGGTVLGGGRVYSREARTTVMIKNVPNKYTKKMLLELLDNHCVEENQKVVHLEQNPVFSAFDFFYLPIDFATGSNLGYAFVNFTSADAALRFHRAFHKWKWYFLGSRKICEVTYARIQGLEAQKKHFQSKEFACSSDDLLPVVFRPHRDGCSAWEPRCVGKRASARC